MNSWLRNIIQALNFSDFVKALRSDMITQFFNATRSASPHLHHLTLSLAPKSTVYQGRLTTGAT